MSNFRASFTANAVDDAFTSITVLSWSFVISGVTVTLVTPEAHLLHLGQSYFRFYPTISSTAPTCHKKAIKIYLRLAPSSASLQRLIPSDSTLIGQQQITSVWQTIARQREHYYFHFNFGHALFRVKPEQGRIVGLISPDALQWPHLMVNTYVFMTLMLALRWRGIYHLHTAAVLSPEEHLTLICGTQRAGKTTLTTALGLAGWRPLSDDGVLLRNLAQHSMVVDIFKRDFHLAAELLTHWEALADFKVRYFYHDRACVDGLTFFRTEEAASVTFTTVKQMLFPQITGEKESSLVPISPGEALQRLIAQSMFFPLNRAHTARQMLGLTSLVKEAACYTLQAGVDIWKDPYYAGVLLQKIK